MQVTDSTASAAVVLHKYWQWTKRGLLLLTSLFSVTTAPLAGTNTWTSIGPDGGQVFDLAFHPTEPSTMYAATSAGFYLSTDSASSWQRSNASSLSIYFRPTALAAGVGGPDRVHIATEFGLVSSDDRGVTLRMANGTYLGGSPSSFAIAAPADGSAIYYAVDHGLYRSTDGGATRELRGTVPGEPSSIISTLRVDPSNPQTVYAATFFGGVYRSTDAGANWTTVFTVADFNVDGVWTMTVDPQNANRIWLATNGSVRVTDDAGVSWQPVLPGTAGDLDVDPRNSQIAYVSMLNGSVMRTTDGGTTWTSLPVPQRPDAYGRARLAIHPTDSARLYLFGSNIFVSTDTGASWSPAYEGIIATSPGRFSHTPTSSGRIFFPVAEHGIGSLRPGGDSVEIPFNPALSVAAGGQPPYVASVLSLPTRLIAAFDNSRIAFSSNPGGSWTLAATPPPSRTHSLAAAAQNGGWTLYAATDSGIYRSDDLGDHWSPSGNGLPATTQAWNIAVAANQMHLYTSLPTGTNFEDAVYRSVDGGQTWSLTPTLLDKRGILALTPHPTDAQTLLVATNEGAFKTTDGGATWRALELFPGVFNSPISAIAIDPVNPDIIYVDQPGTAGNVVRSVDGGVTFQRLMPDYYDGAGAVSLIVDPDQPSRVLAAVPGGGIREMSIEPDLQLTAGSQPATATTNSPMEFTITATNRGPFDATGVAVQVRLPAGTTVASATNNGAACAIASNVVTCTVGIMRNNQAAVIRVSTTTPATDSSFVINADVTGAQPDSVTANNSASATVAVSSRPPASTNSGGGGSGGGGSFDAVIAVALLSMALVRRRPRLSPQERSIRNR